MKLWQLTFVIAALACLVTFGTGALFKPHPSVLATQLCKQAIDAKGREACVELGLK